MNLLFAVAGQTGYLQTCIFGGGVQTIHNQWLQINMVVILVLFAIAAIIYSLSNIFPTAMREKMKGAARVELFQGVISIFIITILLVISLGMCNVTQSLTSSSTPTVFQHAQYTDPVEFSKDYLGNLLFTRSLTIFSDIYTETIGLVIWGNIFEGIEEAIPIEFAFGTLNLGHNGVGIFFGFSSVLSGVFLGLLAITFGVLFIIYLFIVIIEAGALTIIVPVSIIMRSMPFAGPRLRDAADSFLALAIAGYFIFPATILMNNVVVTWLYTPCTSFSALCNPYQKFVGSYQLIDTGHISDYFKTGTIPLGGFGKGDIPSNFFGSSITALGGIGNALSNGFEILYALPTLVLQFVYEIAQYLFEGIFLIALDVMITVGFATGLARGLGSASRILGIGPFWGGG